jgi:predicted MFS family arabinose efflux permease
LSIAHQNRAIALLSLAAFASAASVRLCDPMLPELAKTFISSPAETSQVVSSFSLAYGILQIFYGTWGDRFGKYRLIAFALLLSTLGTVAAALSYSLNSLILCRLLTGASAAGIIPLSMAWIGDTVEYEHRQATLAKFLGGQILGFIAGQFIGGLFTDTLGWRWAFALMALIFLVVGVFVLRESRSNFITHHKHIDPCLQNGLIAQTSKVLSIRWARIILTVVFFEGMVVFGTLSFVPSYLHERFGLSLTMAGALMTSFGIGGFSYILFAKFFVRRFGEVGLALMGGFFITVAWFIFTSGQSWLWALPASYFVGLGFYMLHNTLQTNATQMVPQARGTAVSLFAAGFFLGQALGVTLNSILFTHHGAISMFVVAACAMPIISTFFAHVLRKHHHERKISIP